VKDSIPAIQQARALEPLIPSYAMNHSFALLAVGETDAAIAVLDAMPPRQGAHYALAAQVYARAGRFDDAATQILRINNKNLFGPGEPVVEAARLIRSAPAKVADPSDLPPLHQWVNWIYAYIGAPERLLDYPERALQADELSRVYDLFTRE
jgi:tetratricopeptide (TPR) repeat protein